MDPEQFREKHRTEGFREGVIAERLQTLNTLQRIADAPDIEVALMAEHTRLEQLQARELAAPTMTALEARAFSQVLAAASGHQAPLDNGDLVAAALGLGMPAQSTTASPARSNDARQSQPVDNVDKVAAALGLTAAPAK